jgi:tetratricopeptide (TPR) repeat protein
LSVLNWQQIGSDFLAQNQFADAIALLEPAITQEPSDLNGRNLLAAAHNNLGSAQRSQGNIKAAIDHFQKALDANPSLPNADLAKIHLNIGSGFRDSGNIDQCLHHFKTALELDENLAEVKSEYSKLIYQETVINQGYHFTQDELSRNIPTWQQHLAQFTNQPDLRALEIGSRDGQATCWLIDQILTHASARITCIDTFDDGNAAPILPSTEQRFDANIAKTNTPQKVRKMVGRSPLILRSLIPDSYHFAYIDGSHVGSDMLEATILTWSLVKVGGIIIFDDYGFNSSPEGSDDPPKAAIDPFLQLFRKKIRILHQAFQVIIEKIAE